MRETDHSLMIRWLLRLYPREYRDRYGEEIAALVERELAEADGAIWFKLRLVFDHIGAAGRLHAGSRRGGWGGGMLEDVKWATRSLARARGFTVFAVLTLGLGIGATASVFTVLDRVVLRPFPWEGSDRLVQLGTYILRSDEIEVLSQPLLRDYIEQLEGIEAVVGAQGGRAVLTGLGDPIQTSTLQVSPGYFDFFEGRAVTGRLLGPGDHGATAAHTVVLSHGFWVERFGADPDAVGRSFELDGTQFEIVGVLAPDFTAPQPDFWGGRDMIVAMGLYRDELDEGAFGVRTAARLEEGAAIDDLIAQLTRIGRVRYEDPGGFVTGFDARPLQEMVIGAEIRRSLGRVLGAVGLLLLIGCLNVASLLLTRAAQRADELRVRGALGASRGRLVFQLVAESAQLALAGGLVGIGIAWMGVEFFRRNAPSGIPRLAEIGLDPQAAAATLALSLFTVGLFGLGPAWSASRFGSLRPTATGHSAGRRDRRVRGGLVLLETGLAVVLVLWSGLLARDLIAMATEDPGYRSEGIVAGSIDLAGRPDGESAELRQAFMSRLSESARAIPGVRHVAYTTELPYSGNSIVTITMPEGLEDEGAWTPTVSVDGEYFEAFGIRFVEGRPFDTALDDDRQIAVVNEAFVRQYWPEGRAVGRMIKSGGPDVDDEGSFEVVGVIADVRTGPGQEVPAKMYVDYAWEPFMRMRVVLQVDGSIDGVVGALRGVVTELDPGLPLSAVVTLEGVEEEALRQPAFYATLFSTFGFVALILALIGVYGTTAYATAARGREIGIRVALGEERERIVLAILLKTTGVVGLGIVLGSVGSLVIGRVAADALRIVGANDPVTYGVVATMVLVASWVAAWLPARSLTRINPADTLRREV